MNQPRSWLWRSCPSPELACQPADLHFCLPSFFSSSQRRQAPYFSPRPRLVQNSLLWEPGSSRSMGWPPDPEWSLSPLGHVLAVGLQLGKWAPLMCTFWKRNSYLPMASPGAEYALCPFMWCFSHDASLGYFTTATPTASGTGQGVPSQLHNVSLDSKETHLEIEFLE